jgi:putative hemolysin
VDGMSVDGVGVTANFSQLHSFTGKISFVGALADLLCAFAMCFMHGRADGWHHLVVHPMRV